jgi:hypothetical protein
MLLAHCGPNMGATRPGEGADGTGSLGARRGRPRGQGADEPRTVGEILYHDALEGCSGRQLLDELRKTLIGRDLRVPTAEGRKAFLNLDNAASMPTFEAIWEAVRQAWRQPAQVREDIVREVRSICARVLGAPAPEFGLVFTSNASEAINLVAEALRSELEPGVEPVVVNTLLEQRVALAHGPRLVADTAAGEPRRLRGLAPAREHRGGRGRARSRAEGNLVGRQEGGRRPKRRPATDGRLRQDRSRAGLCALGSRPAQRSR